MRRQVLVQGSVTNGRLTWGVQRELVGRWELVVLDRPGFPPGPTVEWSTSRPMRTGSSSGSSPATSLRSLLRCHRLPPRGCACSGALLADGDRAARATSAGRGHPAADEFAARAMRLWREEQEPEAFLRISCRWLTRRSLRRDLRRPRETSTPSGRCFRAPVIPSQPAPVSTTFSPTSCAEQTCLNCGRTAGRTVVTRGG